jgi:hypothetical protein
MWCQHSNICAYFHFSRCSSEINMKTNNVKYIQGVHFSQLTRSDKAEIKNFGRATSDLVIVQSTWSTIQTYIRKPYPLYTLNVSLKFASPCIIIQFKWTNQIDATISQVYYLTFMYSSTCFGRPYAHHQELNNCGSSLWFHRWSVVIAVLLVVPAGPTTTNSTAITTLQRWNQRLLPQLLSSWW